MLLHNMCLVRHVLLFFNMHVLKMFYEQIKWMDGYHLNPQKTHHCVKTSYSVQIVKISPMVRPVRVTKRQKRRKRNLIATNYVVVLRSDFA